MQLGHEEQVRHLRLFPRRGASGFELRSIRGERVLRQGLLRSPQALRDGHHGRQQGGAVQAAEASQVPGMLLPVQSATHGGESINAIGFCISINVL